MLTQFFSYLLFFFFFLTKLKISEKWFKYLPWEMNKCQLQESGLVCRECKGLKQRGFILEAVLFLNNSSGSSMLLGSAAQKGLSDSSCKNWEAQCCSLSFISGFQPFHSFFPQLQSLTTENFPKHIVSQPCQAAVTEYLECRRKLAMQ